MHLKIAPKKSKKLVEKNTIFELKIMGVFGSKNHSKKLLKFWAAS